MYEIPTVFVTQNYDYPVFMYVRYNNYRILIMSEIFMIV